MAAPAAGFQSLHTPFAVADRARFLESWLRRIAPGTHQDQASGNDANLSPWRLHRPRRTLVPQRVQWVNHRSLAAEVPAPIPCWLTLRAIRVCCKSVTAPGVQFRSVGSNSSPLSWLTGAVETYAKQRVTSNGLRSFRMWKHARASLCASALIATTLFVFAFFRS